MFSRIAYLKIRAFVSLQCVVIYSNNAKITSEFVNPEISIAFTIYKDEFGAITKFIIAPTTSEEENTGDDENSTDEISED